MSKQQILVVVVAALLLALNFTFPYVSYPEKEFDAGRRLLRSTIHYRFMPIWEVRAAQERATLKGNPFDDTIVLWHFVILFAVGIVGMSGWAWVRLRRQRNTA